MVASSVFLVLIPSAAFAQDDPEDTIEWGHYEDSDHGVAIDHYVGMTLVDSGPAFIVLEDEQFALGVYWVKPLKQNGTQLKKMPGNGWAKTPVRVTGGGPTDSRPPKGWMCYMGPRRKDPAHRDYARREYGMLCYGKVRSRQYLLVLEFSPEMIHSGLDFVAHLVRIVRSARFPGPPT